MDTIIINGQSVDPYFMLDVTPQDSIEKINKSFRKKAKIWHPDKMSQQDKLDNNKVHFTKNRFEIIVGCYEYVLNRKGNFLSSEKTRENINIEKNNRIPTKNINNNTDLHNFNDEFEKSKTKTPNDFGYNNTRTKNIDDYKKTEYNLVNIFQDKNFNQNKFNETFEYNQKNQSIVL